MKDFADRKSDRRERTSAEDNTDLVPRPFGDRIVVTKNRRKALRREGHTVIDNDGIKIHFE